MYIQLTAHTKKREDKNNQQYNASNEKYTAMPCILAFFSNNYLEKYGFFWEVNYLVTSSTLHML